MTEPAGAREVPVWRPGDGPLRTRYWRIPPRVEVLLGGEWCPAALEQREDRADGTVVYHLSVRLPGCSSTASRFYAWGPATIRPVQPSPGEPIDTHWDAEGRITGETRPSA
ncbi:hypothetical protein ACWERV_16905 [Streptomyces sp. NPDC004031]